MPGGQIQRLIDASLESLSDAAGALIGLMIAGAPGAIAGAAIPAFLQHSLKEILGDVASRELSHREELKVGTAATHALNKVYERLVAGESPRIDGFFSRLTDERSPADTVLEGVLTTCRFQWEERKLPWIANIYVNAAFGNYPPATVNRVILLADRMSWRQFYALALASGNTPNDMPYDWMIMSNPELPEKQEVLRQEMRDLYAPPFNLLSTDPLGPTVMGMIVYNSMGFEAFEFGNIMKFQAGDDPYDPEAPTA